MEGAQARTIILRHAHTGEVGLDPFPQSHTMGAQNSTEQCRTVQNSTEHTEHTHKPKAMKPSHKKAFQVTSNQEGIKKVLPELFLDIKFPKINFFLPKITFGGRIFVRNCFRCVHM